MSALEIKNPSFVEGVAVAVVASLFGAVLYTAFILMFSVGFGARLTVAFVFSAYLVYLLWRSPKKTGRMTALFFWGVTLLATWFIHPPFIIYVMVHMGAVWLIRSLAFYKSIAPALFDLLLVMLSLAASVWAYLNTHSVLLALWTLFLVQALFAVVPCRLKAETKRDSNFQNDRFMQAYQNAEAALRKFSSL
ncbi:hypothetical protein ACFL2V_06225 [Pseudomonadota bacterium]